MKIGSLVCPHLGGPLMTVESIDGSAVNTMWFDHGVGPLRRRYEISDLRLVD